MIEGWRQGKRVNYGTYGSTEVRDGLTGEIERNRDLGKLFLREIYSFISIRFVASALLF